MQLPSRKPQSIQERFAMFKRTIAVAFVSLSLLAVTACNTVEGAGKDVSSAGRAVSDAADDSK
jgi:predicted small secreted protein